MSKSVVRIGRKGKGVVWVSVAGREGRHTPLLEVDTRKVDCWRNSEQKHRWLATAILDIEPRLRTVAGYRHLPRLRAALQSSMNRSSKAVA